MSVAYKVLLKFLRFKIILWHLFTSGKNTRNAILCSFICVYNDYFTLEFLNLRVYNTHFFLWKRKIVATMLEGYFFEILFKPAFNNIKYESIIGVFFPVFIVIF